MHKPASTGAVPEKPRRWHERGWFKSVRRVACVVLVAYLIILLAMMWFEESLIFVPFSSPDDDWHPSGLQIEDAWFNAADGVRIHGWYVAHENPRAVVLFAHGNAGNVTHRADILRALNQHVGVSVLIFDYRGYGRSAGKPTERGILADARAARAWLARREKIPEGQIVLMGESIGGAVAVDLAADGARGLIVQNSFASLPEVAAYHLPWVPVRLLMRMRLNSAARIRDYHGPLLQSHGDRDTIVPLASAQRLFAAANEPKKFILIPGGDHNDAHSPEYYEQVREFVESLK
jgi:fermentation-respiration switch protein FrsA (DUF1100 family)